MRSLSLITAISTTTDLAVQRHINLEVAEDGSKVIRYTGAGPTLRWRRDR